MDENVNLRKILAQNIKNLRKIMNLSQEKLAEKANISLAMLRDIETCRTWISDKTLVKLAISLKTETFRLFLPTLEQNIEINNVLLADSISLIENMKENIDFDIRNTVKLLKERK